MSQYLLRKGTLNTPFSYPLCLPTIWSPTTMEASRRTQGDCVCPEKSPAYLQGGRKPPASTAGASDLPCRLAAAPGAPYLL